MGRTMALNEADQRQLWFLELFLLRS